MQKFFTKLLLFFAIAMETVSAILAGISGSLLLYLWQTNGLWQPNGLREHHIASFVLTIVVVMIFSFWSDTTGSDLKSLVDTDRNDDLSQYWAFYGWRTLFPPALAILLSAYAIAFLSM